MWSLVNFGQKLLTWPQPAGLLEFKPLPEILDVPFTEIAEVLLVAAKRLSAQTWVSIPGIPGYAANALGQIFSARSGQVMRPSTADSSGRQRVELHFGFRPISGRNSTRFYVARLVLLAFRGPPPCRDCWIQHIDGDKSNNAASNLKWGLSPILRQKFKDSDNVREVSENVYVDIDGNGWRFQPATKTFLAHGFGSKAKRAWIVGRAFLGPQPPGLVMGFKDDNRNNVAVYNLEWRPRKRIGGKFGFFRLLRKQEQVRTAIEEYDKQQQQRIISPIESAITATGPGKYTFRINTEYFGKKVQ